MPEEMVAVINALPYLLQGSLVTVGVVLGAMGLGLMLGVCLAMGQVYGPRFEETRRRVPDVRRAAGALGFEAQVSLEDGLRQTIDWFHRGRDND